MNRNVIALLLGILGLSVIGYVFLSTSTTDLRLSSVMITNLQSNSGGSGTIVKSTNTHSQILTNSHVCEVVQNGGLVHTHTGTHFVKSYKQSKLHDLCLITVPGNLNVNTSVSYRTPFMYEESIVSGFPRLLPNIINTGHFSGRKLIQIMTGIRPCTEEELNNPNISPLCFIAGGVPIVRFYETVVVSNLVQPGSSGSGVYTSNHELGAVIFAGAGDLSYGLAVPYEYVVMFLNLELQTLEEKFPDLTVQFSLNRDNSRKEYVKKVQEICEEQDLDICKWINNVML